MGLHGLGIEGPCLKFLHHALSAAAPTLGVLAAEAKSATAGLPGAVIEDKGLAVVLHVRGASKSDRRLALTRFNALAEPFLNDGAWCVQPGDETTELLPNIDWAKRGLGTRHHPASGHPAEAGGLAGLHRRRHHDEDAFEEIGDSGLTIGVSNRVAGASLRVGDPASVEAFLRAILATD